ncbi:TRAP transporter large permease [Petroclostridium sp. X23]|uniref:TRAP transporter large permease n=1 Tax=Petroclostridium sp. X23 TaxID=3045146 RepID=UPI0024ACE426|nr:TRAP transporter large permease [Petroclostridium sp. X23]WHH56812.1 TRAP transporter large permease [Petroclostridium sp. X23]
MILVLLGSLLLLLFSTVPIAVSLALCTISVFSVFYSGTAMDTMLAQSMVTSTDSFALMAIPFFMLVGTLMEKSGIADKLVDVAKIFTGDKPGGLGMAAVLAAMFFAAISGSGPATTAAIGGIMISAMGIQGYDKAYSGALVASASTIGPVIPPSIPMIMYGVTIGVSVTEMFTAGFLPGIVMGITLMVYNYFLSKKRGYKGSVVANSFKDKMRTIKSGIWAMIMPIIVLGGIYSGIFTPTESAVIGVIYSIIVGTFIYKTLTWRLFKASLIEAAITSATIMILFGGANTFGRLLTIGKIPVLVTDAMLSLTQSPIIIMLLVNVLLLIAGMFIDTISSIILFAPLFTPLMVTLGYDPVFFGVIMVVNLCIGMLTPPLGGNLLVAQRISQSSFESILKETLPLIGVLCIALIILIIFPGIIMFLPNLFGM